jgi:TRAP-type C4-dicarboxylate transport system substrate-binding protein
MGDNPRSRAQNVLTSPDAQRGGVDEAGPDRRRKVTLNGSRPIRRAAHVVVTSLLLVGCGAPAGNKAGGIDHQVVLRMATTDGLPGYKPQVGYLVDRVEQLSAGNVRIDVVYGVGGFARDAEQRIVRGVAAGTYDLGVVGTRVFDTLGVNSFQALTAPMLIDNYPLEQAVIDSDIPARMMQPLDGIHVTGLGVLADGMRNPAAVGKPLLGPEDWRGITFGFFASDQEAAAIRALGARPSGGSATPDARESSLHTYNLVEALSVTANVNLWPQPLGIIGDPDRLNGLTSEQQGWLDQAVRDAAASSTGLVDVDAAVLSDLCASGARLVTASEADIAGLREAFAPVYAQVEQDPQTRGFIAEIEQLKEQTPAGDALTIPDGCTGAGAGSTSSPSSSGQPTTTPKVTPLDGVWGVTYSRDELIAAHPDPSEVTPSNYGHFTLEFHGGDFTLRQTEDGRVEGTLIGTYTVDGDSMAFFVAPNQAETGNHGAELWRYRWSLYRETLTFEKLGGEAPDCSLSVSLGQCEPTGVVVKPWRDVSA